MTDPLSLETPIGDGESVFGDVIEDEQLGLAGRREHEKARAVALANALDALDPRMRRVVERRFGLDGQPPQTLEELGAELGITRERVRQLELRALRQLREQAPGLLDYLRSPAGYEKTASMLAAARRAAAARRPRSAGRARG